MKKLLTIVIGAVALCGCDLTTPLTHDRALEIVYPACLAIAKLECGGYKNVADVTEGCFFRCSDGGLFRIRLQS